MIKRNVWKIIFIPIFLFIQLGLFNHHVNGQSADVISNSDLISNNGRIYIIKKTAQELDIPAKGLLLAHYKLNDVFFFIQEFNSQWLLCSYDTSNGSYSEKIIDKEGGSIKKFKVDDNFFYILVIRNFDNTTLPALDLFYFDRQSLDKSIVNGVFDFDIVNNKLLLINSSGVYYNGSSIPMGLKSNVVIKGIIDDRIILLSDGSFTEIIDLLAERNLYAYKGKSLLPFPVDYNLTIEFVDSFSSTADSLVYYQVLLNGGEEIRTEISHPEVKKFLNLKAEVGKHVIIKAERWELDKSRGRYVRANNLYQPGEVKVFIPENRIVKLKFIFNGEKYSVSESVMEN